MFRTCLVPTTAALLLAVISTGNTAPDAEPKTQLDNKKQLDELNSARAAIESRYNPLVEKARTNATNAQAAVEKFKADSLSIAAKFINDTIVYRRLSIEQVPSDGKFSGEVRKGRRGPSPSEFVGEIFENGEEILDIGRNITTAKVGDLLPNRDGDVSVFVRMSQQAAGGGMSVQAKMYLVTKLHVKVFSRFPTTLDDVRARQAFVQLYWRYVRNLSAYETPAQKAQAQLVAIENEARHAIETWDSQNGAKLKALQDQVSPPVARTPEKQPNIAMGTTPPATAAQSLPAPTVEPYGGLSWDDGFYQVVSKLQKIGGLDHIRLGERGLGDLIRVRTEGELTALLAKPLEEPSKFWDCRSGYLSPQMLGTYRDKSGNEQKYINQPWFGTELNAGPIFLAGYPFELTITFDISPGFAVKFPDRVIRFRKYAAGLVPLAIRKVKLQTNSNPSKEAIDLIKKKFSEKYGDYDTVFKRGRLEDPRGAQLVVFYHENSIYYVFSPRSDLDKFYEEHLDGLAKEIAKKKPDGTKGL